MRRTIADFFDTLVDLNACEMSEDILETGDRDYVFTLSDTAYLDDAGILLQKMFPKLRLSFFYDDDEKVPKVCFYLPADYIGRNRTKEVESNA